MATGKASLEIDSEVLKIEWLHRLDTLVNEVQSGAQASGWRTGMGDKTVTERGLGTYKVPMLFMEKDAVEVVLNPAARFVPGADGAVDLYVAPASDDIASLYFEAGQRVLHYAHRPASKASKGVNEIKSQPYSQETIQAIHQEMAANG